MSLTIRPATRADLPILAQMNKRLIEDEGSRNPMSVAQLEERMRGWLAGEWRVRLFLVAETGEVVGYATYREGPDAYAPEEREIYLRQFYVERGHRGQGLGRLALDLLLEREFPADCSLVLDVLTSNPRGQRFWAAMGMQPYCTTLHRRIRRSPQPDQAAEPSEEEGMP